ncbi:hypothetical protein IFR05_009996 [Cadophora sp. M221]|nr:hypothetical protein IFR05_009996 [Cadophora sp. M221]
MKPSQRQPREVVPGSHLTHAFSTSADITSTLFDTNHNATTSSSSDLSALIDASHVSYAIASSYHALTTQTLRQHNNRRTRRSVNVETTRAYHAGQISASLEGLHVQVPPGLHRDATEGYVGKTPMEYFEGYPSSQYQQLNNYQPLDFQPSYNPLRAMPHPQRNGHSARADVGAEDHGEGSLAYWVPDQERYIHARRQAQDMTEWGEDLSGVGTQFDVPSHSGGTSVLYGNSTACEEGHIITG